jgi:hypothetical protein
VTAGTETTGQGRASRNRFGGLTFAIRLEGVVTDPMAFLAGRGVG